MFLPRVNCKEIQLLQILQQLLLAYMEALMKLENLEEM